MSHTKRSMTAYFVFTYAELDKLQVNVTDIQNGHTVP